MARWLCVAWLAMTGMAALGACADEVIETEGVPCGPTLCEPHQYCCDAACGICQDQGVACTDMCPE